MKIKLILLFTAIILIFLSCNIPVPYREELCNYDGRIPKSGELNDSVHYYYSVNSKKIKILLFKPKMEEDVDYVSCIFFTIKEESSLFEPYSLIYAKIGFYVKQGYIDPSKLSKFSIVDENFSRAKRYNVPEKYKALLLQSIYTLDSLAEAREQKIQNIFTP